MEKNKNIFASLLEVYLRETKIINSGYPYGPFIPHVFEQYGQTAEDKVLGQGIVNGNCSVVIFVGA